MKKRDVVKMTVSGQRPPYVPWHFGFTAEAIEKLSAYYGTQDIHTVTGDHIVELGSAIGFFEDLGNCHFRDVFGVVWNRTVDKDIGIVEGIVLPEPSLQGFTLPDPLDKRFFQDITSKIAKYNDCFRVYCIGFSLFERAWTLRGMENLLMDFIEHPDFVQQLFTSIADYNITQAKEAMKYDIDAVYFGDDWGQQHGLIMGASYWKAFIYPHLRRMYQTVRDAGKFVFIHSCGDVDELFEDLIGIGVNCFNPFQPEVMDVYSLMSNYRGKLSFCGGLSTQKVLPYGSVQDIRRESDILLKKGLEGGYIFSPAHAVEGDVPLENILAFIKHAQQQKEYSKHAAHLPRRIVGANIHRAQRKHEYVNK